MVSIYVHAFMYTNTNTHTHTSVKKTKQFTFHFILFLKRYSLKKEIEKIFLYQLYLVFILK